MDRSYQKETVSSRGSAPERTPVEIEAEALSELTGRYEIASGIVYVVSIENRRLFGAADGQSKLQLLAESESVFFTPAPPASYAFVRDRSGKIGHILFIQDGLVTKAKKL